MTYFQEVNHGREDRFKKVEEKAMRVRTSGGLSSSMQEPSKVGERLGAKPVHANGEQAGRGEGEGAGSRQKRSGFGGQGGVVGSPARQPYSSADTLEQAWRKRGSGAGETFKQAAGAGPSEREGLR